MNHEKQPEQEVERLGLELHKAQKHPDFEYSMTFDGNEAHKSREGWVENPALGDAFHGVADADIYRAQNQPRERYWMREKEQPKPHKIPTLRPRGLERDDGGYER